MSVYIITRLWGKCGRTPFVYFVHRETSGMGIPYSLIHGTDTIPKDVSTLNARGFVRVYYPQLPPELILSILSYLRIRATLMQLDRFHHTVWEEPPPETYLRDARFPLTSLALVSKAWYQHVFLATTRELMLFRRTVTESPDLASLVTHISIVIPRRGFRHSRIRRVYGLRYQAACNAEKDIIHKCAVSVLRECSPITSFTVRLP